MRLFIFLILSLSCNITHAQDVEEPKWKKFFEVSDALKGPNIYKSDSTKFFSFFIKVKLLKDERGAVKVLSIHPSDAILIRRFPGYDTELRKIDFKVLMPQRKQATLVIPFFWEEIGSKEYSVPKPGQYTEV